MNTAKTSHFFLGLDIGGTKCAAVIGDESGQVRARREWASEAFEAEALASAARACRICPAGSGKRLGDCSTLAAAMSIDTVSS